MFFLSNFIGKEELIREIAREEKVITI